MYCDRCGTNLGSSTSCPACGKSFLPMAPAAHRIGGHVRLLGILWLAISAIRLLPGLLLMFLFGPILPPEAPAFVRGILPMIGGALTLGALIGAAVGVGLLMRHSWARMGAIVYGALNLADIPFGTALGIYTLWVLLPAQHEAEYRAMAAAAESV